MEVFNKKPSCVWQVPKADISNIWERRVAPHRCWATISLKLMAKTFVHCIQKLGRPPASIFPFEDRHCSHYWVPQTCSNATALHFSEMKENLLQLSITALFIQPKKFRAKANGNLTDLSHRKAIWLLILQEFFTLPCLATCQQLRLATVPTVTPSWAVTEFWRRSTFEN